MLRKTVIICIAGIISLSAAGQKVDSLKALLEKDTLGNTTRYTVLKKLAREIGSKDPGLALGCADQAYELADSTGIPHDIGFMDFIIYLNDKAGEYNTSIKYLERKIKFLYPPENELDRLMILRSEGYLHFRKADYTKALDNFREAMKIAEKNGYHDKLLKTYFDMARTFERLGDDKKEKEYYRRYLGNAGIEEKSDVIGQIYLRLGNIASDEHEYREALNYQNMALQLGKQTSDTMMIISALNYLAWNHYLMKNYDSSLQLYRVNISLARKYDKQNFLCNCYGNIGNIYRDLKNYDRAIEYYQKSIEVAEKIRDFYNLSWLYEDISKMHATLGNYKQAYEGYILHSRYSDSLLSSRYRRSLYEARAEYEADKKTTEFEVLKMKLRQNRYIAYGLGGGIVLLLVIGGLMFYQNTLLDRQRISVMKQKLSELTQRNLRQQMNPHFIFNTLNSIQYFVFENNKIAANDYMSKFARLMRMTLENSRSTSIPIKDELEALELYLQLESLRFKGKFDWDIRVDEEIDTLLYKIPTMLIQPFVENSIVHGLMNKEEGRGHVRVDLKLKNDHILCSIQDNGIGRRRAMEIKAARKAGHNSLGTKITASRLKLVNSLYGKEMKVHYTDLQDEKGNARGTRVEVTIPVVG